MEIKKNWIEVEGFLYLQDISSNLLKLDNSVYSLTKDVKNNLRLFKIEEKFSFNFKLYGLQDDFIKRVINTYKNTKDNLGVILNGVKGTGKTITAKKIANDLEMPVIIIGKKEPEINDFLSSIPQDIIVFIDEYDKVYTQYPDDDDNEEEDGRYRGGSSSLLSLMDGVYKTDFRKVFLLTTNNMWVNSNMLNRPGRVRYVKTFSDLSAEQIKEIISEELEDKSFTDSIIEFMKPLEIITVDIVRAIIQEVNIYKEPAEICCKDFNVSSKDDVYEAVNYKDNKEGEIFIDEIPYKSIANILNPNFGWKSRSFYASENYYYLMQKPDYVKSIFYLSENNDTESIICVKIRKKKYNHKSLAF